MRLHPLTFDRRTGRFAQHTVLADEHLRGSLVVKQLPVEPGNRDLSRQAAVRLHERTAMPDRQIDERRWDTRNSREIIGAVAIGYVGRPAQYVQDRCVQCRQKRLVYRHAGNRIGALGKDAAIVNGNGFDARVTAKLQRLYPAAAMPRHRDTACIDSVVPRTSAIGIGGDRLIEPGPNIFESC